MKKFGTSKLVIILVCLIIIAGIILASKIMNSEKKENETASITESEEVQPQIIEEEKPIQIYSRSR